MGHFAFLSCLDFYISCERLFNPHLDRKPILVLSNDKCVVARSQEAAELKIPLGIPYLEIKDFCSHNKIHICLSDYKLYGDLSQRMMDILVGTGLKIEVYSIDEAFIQFSEALNVEAAEAMCLDISQKIQKWTGLSVAIGLAPTKTLAKIANQKARKNELRMINLCCSYEKQMVLETFPVKEVCGMNENNVRVLSQLDVHTTQQFCDQDPLLIRQKIGKAAERTLWELRGLSCLIREDHFTPEHSIAYFRSFDYGSADIEELSESLSAYTEMAYTQLKEQNAYAQGVYIFLESTADRYYGYAVAISTVSEDSNAVVDQTRRCLQKIFQKKDVYKKCGIIFIDLQKHERVSYSFQKEICPKHMRFKQAINCIDEYFAKDAVFLSERASRHEWKMRSDKCSLQYANSRSGLAFVKA